MPAVLIPHQSVHLAVRQIAPDSNQSSSFAITAAESTRGVAVPRTTSSQSPVPTFTVAESSAPLQSSAVSITADSSSSPLAAPTTVLGSTQSSETSAVTTTPVQIFTTTSMSAEPTTTRQTDPTTSIEPPSSSSSSSNPVLTTSQSPIVTSSSISTVPSTIVPATTTVPPSSISTTPIPTTSVPSSSEPSTTAIPVASSSSSSTQPPVETSSLSSSAPTISSSSSTNLPIASTTSGLPGTTSSGAAVASSSTTLPGSTSFVTTTTQGASPATSQIANGQQALSNIATSADSTRLSTTLYTLTSSGEIVIVTSIVTAIVPGSNAAGASSTGSGRSLNDGASKGNAFFANSGAVAGTFVVVGLVAAGLLIALGFFFFRRKRARQLDEDIRVAAGGAGDGGAGVNRFADEDEDDPFSSASEGTHAGLVNHHRYMSSMQSNSMSGIAGAGLVSQPSMNHRLSGGGGAYFERTTSPVDSMYGAPLPPLPSGSHSPTHGTFSTIPAYAAGYSHTNQPSFSGGSRSHEGALYPDWAEYVDENAGDHSGSGEGNSAQGHSSQSHPDFQPMRNQSTESFNPAGDSGPDDRLDPHAMRQADQASLVDGQDYTRRILRVTNPED